MNDTGLLFKIITYTSAISSFIPFAIASINFRKLERYFNCLFFLLFINVVMELINFIISKFGGSNQYIYYYFTAVEFTLISLFYSLFFKSYFHPLLINLLIPLFILTVYIDYKVYGINSTYNFSASIEAIVFIIYSMSFFYYVLKNLVFDNLLTTPVFWVNTGILFYFSGNFILFMFSNYLIKNQPEKCAVLWMVIHTFFNLLYNILLSIGFWKTRNK